MKRSVKALDTLFVYSDNVSYLHHIFIRTPIATVESTMLDAGYASKELFEYFRSADALGKNLLLRMPAKKGYLYKTLYHRYKTLLSNAKYEFIRQGHTYFGYRTSILIFEIPMNAYI